jgi:UDP-N-acetylglucosamine--N-acetylmuramyl-(pentapeptide) pyrophosphoryl-undecaprenol N-acetylglucosamine transferase
MDLAFSAANLVLSRAGSATVSELAALGLPAILVPYAAGNGEQALNAKELVSARGARLVSDVDLTPQWVTNSLVPLLADTAEIARMALAAGTVGRRSGSADLLVLVREALADASA